MAPSGSLTVEDLACRRDGRRVFSGLSFGLARGEVRLLRGPNGVGKSSLLRTLAGLLPAAAGRVAMDGMTPDDVDAWTERVAYAGHLDAIKPQLTVAENLRFWADLFGAPAIEPALAAFDLAGIAGRSAHACSAGQKRRLGLARLLLAPRRLWLLDEPTVALDAAAVARFTRIVADHLAGGGMALVATHVDLALRAGPAIVMAPETPGAERGAADPFLDGAFA
jgi:heme exporter protein A